MSKEIAKADQIIEQLRVGIEGKESAEPEELEILAALLLQSSIAQSLEELLEEYRGRYA